MKPISIEQVKKFLTIHFDEEISNVEQVGKGLWSQAFFFSRGNSDFVIRFGSESESYEKDKIAHKYFSDKLPIPIVTETGTALGHSFAISERCPGIMIDELSENKIEKLIPAILDMLNALRQSDISTTNGYGHWNKDEIAQYLSWQEFLFSVDIDDPKSKIYGWKKNLETSPNGIEIFNKMTKKLKILASESYENRHLVHTDLLHFNVIAENNRISAVIDWGNAIYGDFLYDLANFTFWSPFHQSIRKIDWKVKAIQYFKEKGIEIPDFDTRLKICELHIGLAGMAWNAYNKNWKELDATIKRIIDLVGN